MRAWLQRNALPISLVILASVVVIIGFELIDAATTSAPITATDEGDQALNAAGLIKVTLFLLVPALITLAVRRSRSD